MFYAGLIRSLLVPAAALIAASAITAAHASTPMTASGTLTTTSSAFNNIRSAGGNTIIGDLTATVAYTGTLSGTSDVQGLLIFHPDGSATAQDIVTFTGAVNGVPGTVTLRLSGRSSAAGVWRGTDVVLSATGQLAGLHGVLDEVGTIGANGPVGTYTGTLESGTP